MKPTTILLSTVPLTAALGDRFCKKPVVEVLKAEPNRADICQSLQGFGEDVTVSHELHSFKIDDIFKACSCLDEDNLVSKPNPEPATGPEMKPEQGVEPEPKGRPQKKPQRKPQRKPESSEQPTDKGAGRPAFEAPGLVSTLSSCPPRCTYRQDD